MKKQLIHDIDAYISYLNREGYFVTVHGKGISGLLGHNIHRNPFCALVKTDREAWQKCIACQQRVFKEHKKECLFSMCYAGMEEYVFFINDKTFVSVSGYGINKERAQARMSRLAQEFYLDKAELLRVYENSLKHTPENREELAVLMKPLCHMLYLLQMLLADVPKTETESTVYDSLLNFVQYNFMNDIRVGDIAQACSCSESTVHHLFKRFHGKSVKQYIAELRINQAKKLLETSDMPVGSIAQMCGFSNLNYFPTAFKKAVGMSPTEYRGRQ